MGLSSLHSLWGAPAPVRGTARAGGVHTPSAAHSPILARRVSGGSVLPASWGHLARPAAQLDYSAWATPVTPRCPRSPALPLFTRTPRLLA